MSNKTTIGTKCHVYDGPHATPTKTEQGPVYLGIDAITDDGHINQSEYSHLSDIDYKTWTKRVTPQYGDLVFSYEATLGRYALIPEGFHGCLGRRLAVVRPKDNQINIRWLYYYFLSPEWKVFIANHTVKGSTVNRISVEDFPQYSIPLLDRPEQDRIVSVLGAIDEKIALNERINEELEAMAKTLYDYWFVQFDFPDENGKPYRTSGGAMEYNDQLKRKIPKGWKVERIIDVFDVCYGFPFDTEQFTDSVDGYPVVRIRDILDCTISAYTGEKVDEKYWLKNNDLIIGMDGNFHMNFWNNQPALLNQRCFRIRAINGYSVMQALFSAKPYIKSRELNVNRTTVGHLSADDVKALYILTPPEPYQSTVTKILDSALCNISNNARENIELTRLRDWLLPMLMSGHATVADEQPMETPQNVVEMPGNDKRFDLWLQNQGIAARGDLDKKTLREIFDAMDDDDK